VTKPKQIHNTNRAPLMARPMGSGISANDHMDLAGRRVMFVRARLVEPIAGQEWVTLFEVGSYRRWAVALASAVRACDDVYAEAEAITEAALLKRDGIKGVRRARAEAGSWADWEMEPLILAAKVILNPERNGWSHLVNAREQFRLAWAELEEEFLKSSDVSDERMSEILGCTPQAVRNMRLKQALTIRFT
jgi:hypothetical protein